MSSSVKHNGGDVIVSSGTGSSIFIDDVTHDGSSRIHSEVFRNIFAWQFKERCNQTYCEIQDNDPKHTPETTKQFIRDKKWKVLDWLSQSSD